LIGRVYEALALFDLDDADIGEKLKIAWREPERLWVYLVPQSG
jgi:hypothetical protein